MNYIHIQDNRKIARKAVLTKEEREHKRIFDYYDCLLINNDRDLALALEQGEYVIGASFFPLEIKYVYHYENGRLDVFKVQSPKDIHPLMKIDRLQTTISKHTAEDCLGTGVFVCDKYIASHKNHLLDLESVSPINHSELDEQWKKLKQKKK